MNESTERRLSLRQQLRELVLSMPHVISLHVEMVALRAERDKAIRERDALVDCVDGLGKIIREQEEQR